MSRPPPPRESADREDPPLVPDHTLLRRIGAGSYGEVWLARNVMGTSRAVKIVWRRSFDSARPYECEFAGLQKFEPISRRHESQLDILHVGRDDARGCFYYVMELADSVSSSEFRVPGSTPASSAASQLETRNPEPETYSPRTLRSDLARGRLPVPECTRLGLALATALEHLHSHGLVHRDIKPSNIVFVEGQPKLADIGLVTDAGATMSCVGTEGYLPPEGPGTPQADIFGLGKVLYEISTGRDRKDFPDLPADFAEILETEKEELREFNAVVLKACQPRPSDRYATAAALRSELELLQAGQSVRQHHTLQRQLAHFKAWGRWAVAAIVIILAGFFAWQWKNSAALQAARRESLLREVQMIRQTARTNGWFDSCWGKIREVARLKVDDDARTQAAACLNWPDAKLVNIHTNAGAFSLTFSPDGARLLCAGVTDKTGANAARLGRMTSGTNWVFDSLPVIGDAVAAWRADGTPILFQPGGADNFVLRNATNGLVLADFPLAGEPWQGFDNHPVLALSVSGHTAAASVSLTNDSGRFAVWDTASGRTIFQTNEPASALAFSPDGRAVAVGDAEGRARVFSVPDFALLAEFPSARLRINCFAFTRDPIVPGAGPLTNAWWLAVGDAGGGIRVFRTATREQLRTCHGSLQDVFTLAFHPDGVTLASAGRGEVRFWDAATGGEALLRLSSQLGPLMVLDYVCGIAFTSDGSRFALGNEKRWAAVPFVSQWALELHRGMPMLRGLHSPVTRVWLSPDGRWLAALANNWQLAVWEQASGHLRWIFETPQGETADNAGLAFHTNSTSLAFCAGMKALRWNLADGRIEQYWSVPLGHADDLAFDRENHLWLLRNESLSVREHPFRWTLRLLDGSPTGRVRFAQQDFTEWHANKRLAVIPERSCFVVSGGEAGDPFWRIICFSLPNGALLWNQPISAGGQPYERDPNSEMLVYSQTNEVVLSLLPSGRQEAVLPGAFQPAPGGRVFACEWEFGYRVIFGRSLDSPALNVGSDFRASGVRERPFSRDGRRLVWGTENGFVFVAELAKIRRRLRELILDADVP